MFEARKQQTVFCPFEWLVIFALHCKHLTYQTHKRLLGGMSRIKKPIPTTHQTLNFKPLAKLNVANALNLIYYRKNH
jgi:hypothetical protein